MALESSTTVFQLWRFRSSICMDPQNDSMGALSQQSPTVPIEPMSPRRRTFSVKAQDVNWGPWSEWITVVPDVGLVVAAMDSASFTRADSQCRASIVGDVADQ